MLYIFDKRDLHERKKNRKKGGWFFVIRCSWQREGVLCPFHLFHDSGGVYVKVQPGAELNESLRDDIHFVQGKINFYRLGTIIFVVVVVLRKRENKRIWGILRCRTFRSPYLNLTNVKHWPDGQSPGPLQVSNTCDPHLYQGVRGDGFTHLQERKTDVFQVNFFVLESFDEFFHRGSVRVNVLKSMKKCKKIF